jgi:hypothetical protein
VNNLSSAVRPIHTFTVVSLLEESPGCLITILKQWPEYGLKDITIEAQKLFRATDEYQRDIHHCLDIHNVIHKEYVPDGKTVKHESYVHELQNL